MLRSSLLLIMVLVLLLAQILIATAHEEHGKHAEHPKPPSGQHGSELGKAPEHGTQHDKHTITIKLEPKKKGFLFFKGKVRWDDPKIVKKTCTFHGNATIGDLVKHMNEETESVRKSSWKCFGRCKPVYKKMAKEDIDGDEEDAPPEENLDSTVTYRIYQPSVPFHFFKPKHPKKPAEGADKEDGEKNEIKCELHESKGE